MRVIHVAPDLSRAFGGPTQALLGFLRASREAGIDAAVVAPAPPESDREWFVRQAGGAEVHVFPTWGRGSARVSTELLRFLRAERRRFDVVHVHGMFNAISTFAARHARAAKVPYVIGPFGTLSRYTFAHKRSLLKRVYHSRLDAPAIRDAGALHFTTVHERDEARRLAAVREVPAAVVPPPWVPDDSAAAPTSKRVIDPGGKSRGETVLFLSRLHPIKGLETLLDAWPAVRAARPTARLVIAGSGEPGYERSLKERAARRDGEGSIRFTGFVTGDEKARLLGDADVFVLPSYHENFGVAVLEAVAAGLPAVVSPEVQIAEIVQENHLGLVVPREPATIANGILDALGDIALRERCASRGASIARSLFTPESVGERLREMYDLARSR